ncbi:MAG: DUF2520 domain-containing protein [Bacteroidales bacterium]|jgi:predicted short-subunit dehydrogenase-like oxidoreductase (DUF2520 family)|nr:DUF2520 domain-containing protein [Bacteroidales bacterium]MDD4703282.1 DUF2520 domain-containing protein [Bacteroidales bacterium]
MVKTSIKFNPPKTIKSVTIIGKNGNVSWHLQNAFSTIGITCTILSSREKFKAKDLDSDLIIIAVTDSAVENVAKKIKPKHSIIVHTSGSLDMSILRSYANNYGVIYPLQTLSKEKAIKFSEIPICIEGSSEEVMKSLIKLAKRLSKNVSRISSSKRLKLHLAAVFCSNFTNHLIGIAKEILEKEEISPDILNPLIKETVEKAKNNNPFIVQTGPAVREDYYIMQKHLSMLLEDEREVYEVISSKIINRKRQHEKTENK